MFILLFLLLISVNLYPVTTKYVGDLKFEKIEDYTLSNVSFLENGTIELSPDIKEIFSSEEMIWSFDEFKEGILIGTGEKATLLFLNEKETKKVFSSDHILFSDISVLKGKILVSALPDATLFVLGSNFKIEMRLSFSNQYIWKIIPYGNKIFLLSGNPAQLYILNKEFKIESKFDIRNEKNILNGIIFKDELYFYGDSNVFYKMSLKTQKICALLSVDENIADICSDGEKIYILTSISKVKEVQKKDKKNQGSVSSDSDISNPISTERTSSTSTSFSKLYRYNVETGTLEEIFKKSNLSEYNKCGNRNRRIRTKKSNRFRVDAKFRN